MATPVSTDQGNINAKAPGLTSMVDQWGSLPYPSGAFGTLLALRGVLASKDKAAVLTPTRALCFTFGAANLLGTYMMFVDPHNGAGFNFAWNSLYLIVNWKQAVKLAVHGKLVPAGFSAFALFNAGVYGKRYFWLLI